MPARIRKSLPNVCGMTVAAPYSPQRPLPLYVASEFVMATVKSAGIVRSRRTPADWLAGALVIIGAINWGLVGLLQLDLVAAIFGATSLPSKAVYVLVGLAAVYCLVRAFVPAKPTSLAKL